jgi:hypothetical protein
VEGITTMASAVASSIAESEKAIAAVAQGQPAPAGSARSASFEGLAEAAKDAEEAALGVRQTASRFAAMYDEMRATLAKLLEDVKAA